MTRPDRQTGLLLLVFVGGVSSLGAEIAAARLLAPYFGASTIIWANTIGVVLVALSIGYWLGGRLADRRPREHDLRVTALIAAGLLAVIPLLSSPFFELTISAFDDLDAGAFLGSLIGVLLLVAAPVILLGTLSPWAIRLAVTDVSRAGEIAGRLYAVSTIGSLLGTFLSALLLIPFAGTQRTFIIFAAALALTAAWKLPRRMLLAPVVILALLLLPPGLTKGGDTGDDVVIHEQETEYQYLRVLEDPETKRRVLELNEGQAVHSVYERDKVLVGGPWDGYSILPLLTTGQAPRRIAMLGNAAGTVTRAYERFYPETAIDGVEIDPDVSDVGVKYFDMNNPKLTVHDDDARPFLRASDGGYDMIGVDAYRQPYIPFYLSTKEFFALVRDRLTPTGVLILNAGHPENSDELEKTLSATIATVFPHVRRFPIAENNTLVVASRVPISTTNLPTASAQSDPDLAALTARVTRELAPALTGGDVYTDDKAPVEWLIDTSIVNYATAE